MLTHLPQLCNSKSSLTIRFTIFTTIQNNLYSLMDTHLCTLTPSTFTPLLCFVSSFKVLVLRHGLGFFVLLFDHLLTKFPCVRWNYWKLHKKLSILNNPIYSILNIVGMLIQCSGLMLIHSF